MTTHEHRVLHTGGRFFESPRWYDGRWWVSDMFGDEVLSISPDGQVVDRVAVPGHPSGLGWLPDGQLLVVLMEQRVVLRAGSTGVLDVHADLGHVGAGPANDMLVGADGRAWVGSLGFDMGAGETPVTTDLAVVHPDGTVASAAPGLLTPNGAVLLSDGVTFVVAETFASRLTSFRVADDGTLTDRAVWAQLAPPPPLDDLRTCLRNLRVAPDGIALDADDTVWVADAGGGGCVRIARGGAVLERVESPEGLQVFACALGGPSGRSLLLCCAPDAMEHRRLAATDAILVAVDVEERRGR